MEGRAGHRGHRLVEAEEGAARFQGWASLVDFDLRGHDHGKVQGKRPHAYGGPRMGANVLAEHVQNQLGERVQHSCRLRISFVCVDEAGHAQPGADPIERA